MTLRLPRLAFLGMPLLRKEVVGLLRTKRAFWLLIFTVGISSLLPLLAWPSEGSHVVESDRTVLLAGIFLWTQLTVALLIIPAFAAGAISGEREQGTYDLLHATLLSPASIVASKALAAAGYVFLMLLASAPAITVLHLLGGVDMGGILKCYAITFAAVVMSALVCLWSSMRSERTARAVLRGAVGVILWNGGFLFLLGLGAALLQVRFPNGLMEATFYACCFLWPHFGIGAQLSGATNFIGFGGQFASLGQYAWIAHVAGASVVSAVYFARLLRRVRTPGTASPLGERLAALGARKRARPLRRPLLTHVILGIGRDGGPLGNPVFLKEIRSEFFGKPWYRRIVFVVPSLIFLGILGVQDGAGGPNPGWAIAGITSVALFLVAILAPGVAASAFPREIEQGNIDFLRGTLVPLRQALRGKLLASLYATFGIIAAALWGIAVSAIVFAAGGYAPRGLGRDGSLLRAVLVPAGILVTTWVLVTAVATFASVLSRRTLPALVGTYAALLAWFVVLPLVWLVAGGWREPEILIVTHPLGALIQTFESSSRDGAVFGFFLFHAALVFALWLASASAVERLRGRDP